MATLYGYALTTERLKNAPTLRQAIELMPAMPPRCSDIEIVRRWEASMRWWCREVLFCALEREKAGLNDHRGIDFFEGCQAGAGDTQVQAALPILPDGQAAGCPGGRDRIPLQPASRTDELPRWLTTGEVADLAAVGRATVRRAAFETRAGMHQVGSPWYLPRARRVRAGYRREDVIAWLRARGQMRPAVIDLPAEPQERLEHQRRTG